MPKIPADNNLQAIDEFMTSNPYQGPLELSMANASREDPGAYSEDLKIAKDNGVDVETVRSDPKEFKARSRSKAIDLQALLTKHPKTSEYMARPSNAAVSFDDLQNLKDTEDAINRTWAEVGTDTAVDLGHGVVQVGESAVGMANLFTGNMAGDLLGKIGYDPKRTHQILSDLYSEKRQAAEADIQQAEGFFGTAEAMLENPSAAAGQALQSLPMMLGIMGATKTAASRLLAKNGLKAGTAEAAAFLARKDTLAKLTTISAATEGGMSTGQLMEQARQDGVDWNEAVLPAVGAGITTALVGKVAGKILPDVEAQAAIAGMTGKKTAKEVAKKIVKGAAEEGVLEELPQSAMEQVWQNIAYDRPWDEGVGAAAAQGMMAGALAGGGMSAVTGAQDVLSTIDTKDVREQKRVLKSFDEQNQLDAIISLAQESTTNQNAKDNYREFLNGIASDKEVLVSAEIAAQIPNPPEVIAEQLDGGGADVAIPLATFATEIVPNEEVMSVIRPHMRLSNDTMTQTEMMSDDQSSLRTVMEKAVKNADTRSEADRIYEQVKDQIKATGRQSAETARLSAQIIPAYVATVAERRGIPVAEVYKAMGLEIVGPEADVQAGAVSVIAGQPAYQDAEVIYAHARDAFKSVLPEDASIEEVDQAIQDEEFSPAYRNFLQALERDDWLGFDYPAQAVDAVMSEDQGGFELSQGLKAAIGKMVNDPAVVGTRPADFNRGTFDPNNPDILAQSPESAAAEDRYWSKWEPEVTSTGTIKGAPEWVNRAKDKKAALNRMYRDMGKFVREGTVGRYWYEDSARAVLQIVDGDIAEAERLIQLLAIYSPQASVDVNTTFAVRAWNQWKNGVDPENFSVKTEEQDLKAIDVLYNGRPFKGRKTPSFYQNLMHEIVNTDPEAVAKLQLDQDIVEALNKPVAVDMWMYRSVGHEADAAGDDKGTGRYSFTENATRRITARLNLRLKEGEERWTPHQVQAAIWSAVKARYELPDVKEKTWRESIKKGYATIDDEGQRKAPTKAKAKRMHHRIWRKHAMSVTSARAIEAANRSSASFATFINRATQVVTWEAMPSAALDLEVNGASLPVRQMFTAAARDLLIENGVDQLARRLGVPLARIKPGEGAYAGVVSPNSISYLTPDKGRGEFSIAEVRAYTRALQYIYKQEAVPWARLDERATTTQKGVEDQKFRVIDTATGRVVPKSKVDTLAEAQAIADAKGEGFEVRGGKFARGVTLSFDHDLSEPEKQQLESTLGAFTLVNPTTTLVVNFRNDQTGVPTMPDEEFFAAFDNVNADLFSMGMLSASPVWAEGEYGDVYDWQSDNEGSALLDDPALAGRPDLQEWLLDRRAQFEQLLEEFSGENLAGLEQDAAALLTGVGPKDGRAFRDFFANVVSGQAGKSDTGAEYVSQMPLNPDTEEFVKEYAKHAGGNFDAHIAYSIPGFKETQITVGHAISQLYGPEASMLDIGASEGGLAKAITATGGPQTVAFDPNPVMAEAAARTTVPGSTYALAAFSDKAEEGVTLWKEGDTPIPGYDPQGQRFDVVHEAMVFQFMNDDRAGQIKRIKELMKEDGLVILEEKVRNPNWAANEAVKDEIKRQYFHPKDMTEKAKAVLEGMNENMVSQEGLQSTLQDNFQHVEQFWFGGNFVGYVASDSADRLDAFMQQTGRLEVPAYPSGQVLQQSRVPPGAATATNIQAAGYVRSDGVVPLTHISAQAGLTVIDPGRHGTAAAGAEKRRAGRDFIPRSYYYLPGQQPETVVTGRAKGRYFTTVKPDEIYDIAGDPDGLRERVLEKERAKPAYQKHPGLQPVVSPNALEQEILAAGYKGYWADKQLKAVALFEPQPVTEVTGEVKMNAPAGFDGAGAQEDPTVLTEYQTLNQAAGQGALTADHYSLAAAQEMLDLGVNAEKVRQTTGWYRGLDGKWRFEISDSAARLSEDPRIWDKRSYFEVYADLPEKVKKALDRYERMPRMTDRQRQNYDALVAQSDLPPESPFSTAVMEKFLDHPALYAAYPGLRRVVVTFDHDPDAKRVSGETRLTDDGRLPSIRVSGDMASAEAKENFLSVLLHEIQHGIQSIEGFASGGDLAGGVDRYRRLAGEVEARATQARAGLTPEELRMLPLEYDVPASDVIVTFGGKEMQNAPTPDNVGTILPQEGEQAPRAQIHLFDNKRVIQLGQASDLSSFLHEAGHLFLEMEKQLAKQYGLTEDQRAMLDWMGASSFDDVTMDMHEKFAETFEAYLREGKAPSVGLREAFARFRQWLTRIYQTLKMLPRADLNEEITGVFDRMLATDAEIAQMQGNPVYEQFFRSQEQAGMTDAEWEKYQERVARAKDRTVENLDQKLLKEWRQHRTREWEEEKAPLVDEEKNRLAEEPVYKILSETAEYPMDRKVVKELLGVDKLPRALYGKTAAEGVDPVEYAEVHGFPNAKDMLTAVVNAPSLTEAADTAAQARMVEKYGDILNDGTIEEEAIQAMQNADRVEVLLAELRALKKQANSKVTIDREFLKSEAVRMIQRMKFGDIKPHRYYQAELRAARRATTADNPQAALEAKVQQIINHYLYVEARDTRAAMEKHRRYVKKMQTRTYKAGQVNPEYSQNIATLANLYHLKNPADKVQALDGLLNWYLTQINDENQFVEVALLDPTLVDALAAKKAGNLGAFKLPTFKDLTAEQLRGLYDMLRHLRHVGGQMADEAKAEVAAQREQLTESVLENKEKDFGGRRGLATKREKRRRMVSHLINKIPSLRNLMRKLDGFKENGLAYQMIYRTIEDAHNRKLELHRELFEKFDQEMGDVHKVGLNAKGRTPYLLEDGTTLELTVEERFMMALYWGTDTSREAIRQGFGVTDADVIKILNDIPDDQLDLLNATWRVNESVWPELSGASTRLYGVAPPKLEATPFKIRDRVLTGGHMRLFYDSTELELKAEQDKGKKLSTVVPSKAGSLYSRIGSGGRAPVLDKNNIARALEEAVHFIAFAEPGSKLRAIVNASDVKGAITRKHGDGFYKALIENVDSITSGRSERETLPAVAALARLLRRAQTFKYLAYSLRNTVQQFSAIPIAMEEVGTVNWVKAFARYIAPGHHAEMVEFVNQRSKFMRDRGDFVNREAAEYLRKLSVDGKAEHYWRAFAAHGFTPQTLVDSLVAYPVWVSKYEAEMTAHGDDQRAMSAADTAVAESVGSGADLHLGGIFHSTNTEWVRTFTIFGTWFNAYYQRMYRATKGGTELMSMEAGRALLTTPFIVAVLASVMIYDVPDEDKDEEWLAWALKRYGAFMGGTIPLIRDIVGTFDGFAPKTVLASGMEVPARFLNETESFVAGNQSGLKTASDLFKLGTTIAPVPGAGNLTRLMDYADSYNQGKEGRGFNVPKAIIKGPTR